MPDLAQNRTAAAAPRRLLIVESDPALGSLWARTIRTSLDGVSTRLSSPHDLSLDLGPLRADLAICGCGPAARSLFDPLERLVLYCPGTPILLMAPADAFGCIDRALALGASHVLLQAPGYLEQLPVTVRSVLARAARETDRLAALSADLAQVREENLALGSVVDRLRSLATSDPLTGLLNRRGVEERLEQATADARRHGGDVSVLMIDIDNLKHVNDVLGHQAGDDLLRVAADCIRAQCRRADIAGRTGGDEFIVLLPRTPAEKAVLLAERLRARFDALAAPVQARIAQTRRALGVVRVVGRNGRSDGALGMTIGLTSLSTAGSSTGPGLLARADQALYAGKREGKGRVVLYRATGAGDLALAG